MARASQRRGIQRGAAGFGQRRRHLNNASKLSWYVVAIFASARKLSFSAYSVVIQKNKTNPAIQTPHDLYERAFRGLVKGIVRRRGKSSRYRIFAADLELQPKKSAFLGTLKSALSSESGLRYHVHSHPAHSHHMLQVGDYICWAIARKWERGDSRSHALVASKIVVEFDFFRKGTTEYY
ncbi:DUF3800 domain-containing protein [bacterium]|nr:MAG: DUF3800 domain-containing protein [bacterium]